MKTYSFIRIYFRNEYVESTTDIKAIYRIVRRSIKLQFRLNSLDHRDISLDWISLSTMTDKTRQIVKCSWIRNSFHFMLTTMNPWGEVDQPVRLHLSGRSGEVSRHLTRTYIYVGTSVNRFRDLHIRRMQTHSTFHIQNRLDSHSSRDESTNSECLFTCWEELRQ